jgi:hypothetical protein
MQYLPPEQEFVQFENEDQYEEKMREWGLVTTVNVKKDFWYKLKGKKYKVTIKGYEVHGEHNTIVMEFEDGNLSCIHPGYLKEMQASNFGKETFVETEMEAESESEEKVKPKKAPKKENKKAVKKEKIQLPEGKVMFAATVKDFASKLNPFTEKEEEFLLLEGTVVINENKEIVQEIGNAYCGYSKTLKAKELQEGDTLQFEAKIVAKKFDKDFPYKLNNPSKIEKKDK